MKKQKMPPNMGINEEGDDDDDNISVSLSEIDAAGEQLSEEELFDMLAAKHRF